MESTIEWQTTFSGGGKHRKLWGDTSARGDDEIIAAFVQQWQKVLVDMLAWYTGSDANTLVCAVNAYEGTIDFALRHDFELSRSLPGCHLHFDGLEEVTQGDFPDDDAFEVACRDETQRYIGLLMSAWKRVQTDTTITRALPSTGLPFRIVESPDPRDPPLLEEVLRGS